MARMHIRRYSCLYRWLLFVLYGTISAPIPWLRAQPQKQVYRHASFWSKAEVAQIWERSNFGVGFDYIYRSKNELGRGSPFTSMLRESFRPWVHYQFSPNARLSISPIGYMRTYDYIAKPSDYARPVYHELRTTFQFFHHQKQWKGRIMHTWRYRYEMRWQEIPFTDRYRFIHRIRFRYRIRCALKSQDFYADKTLYLMASNEIGLNFGPQVIYSFNQNRLYAGIGYRFLTAVRAELRYVNRFRTRGSTGFEYDLDQGFMLALYIDQLSLIGTRDILKVRYFD